MQLCGARVRADRTPLYRAEGLGFPHAGHGMLGSFSRRERTRWPSSFCTSMSPMFSFLLFFSFTSSLAVIPSSPSLFTPAVLCPANCTWTWDQSAQTPFWRQQLPCHRQTICLSLPQSSYRRCLVLLLSCSRLLSCSPISLLVTFCFRLAHSLLHSRGQRAELG